MIIINGKKVSESFIKTSETKDSKEDEFRFNTLKEAQKWNDIHRKELLNK